MESILCSLFYYFFSLFPHFGKAADLGPTKPPKPTLSRACFHLTLSLTTLNISSPELSHPFWGFLVKTPHATPAAQQESPTHRLALLSPSLALYFHSLRAKRKSRAGHLVPVGALGFSLWFKAKAFKDKGQRHFGSEWWFGGVLAALLWLSQAGSTTLALGNP